MSGGNKENKEVAGKECLSIFSPEVLWHGGADNGKPEPIFSVDMHPSNVLATAGNDENLPPKGSVRLWKVEMDRDAQEFLIEFNDHQSVVNAVRFSPCGKMIASGSDKQIVVYKVPNAYDWQFLTDVRGVERIWLRPSLDEIFDIRWSPDSSFIIAGALDNKAEILRVSTRDSMIIPGHTNYVQGVAWDPLNQLVVTQSADRTCKTHILKYKAGAMVKLATRGHVVAKFHGGLGGQTSQEALTAADFGMPTDPATGGPVTQKKQQNLFADYTVQSYFRRPDFSPDGTLLLTPTGIHRPIKASVSGSLKDAASTAAAARAFSAETSTSFCTHVFWREHLHSPILSLTGLEDPSVAVRCCPLLYKLVKAPGEATPECMVAGKYRIVFAVVTLTAVYVYDTQHAYPLARVGGLHFACINDATWSADGRMLTVCSSDGYLTFIKFREGALGELLPIDEVPSCVQTAFPCLYHKVFGIEPPAPVAVAAAQPSVKEAPPHTSVAPAAVTGADLDAEPMAGSSISDAANPPLSPTPVAVPDSIESVGSDTKKRRIAPTVLGAVGAASNYGNIAGVEPGIRDPNQVASLISAQLQSSSSAVQAVVAAATSDAGGEQKKKRRITPLLVTQSLPLDIVKAPAEAFKGPVADPAPQAVSESEVL